MKIGVLIDRLNVGGVEKIAIEEVKALRGLGHEASLVVLRKKSVVEGAFPDLLKDLPIVYLDQRLPRVFRLSFRFPVFHFFSSFHVTYPLFIPFVVKRDEFDYLIVHGTYTSLTAIALKKRRHIKFSAFIWDPASYILDRVYTGKFLSPILWLLRKAAVALDKLLIDNMEVVLVGGTAHNDFIHKLNPAKSIQVVYPSTYPAPKPLRKDDYVMMITAWKRGKNPEYLLEILRELPAARIKMAGKWVDPLYEQEFRQLVHDNHFEGRIDIIGGVSETQLSELYAHARVLLQTNDDRGFGMPAMEAASQGTTFIIPEGQGVCALFVDGEDGYYTKEKDTPKIVSLLSRLLEDKELAVRMGNTAWKKIKDSYSWEKHAQKLDLVIHESLAEAAR